MYLATLWDSLSQASEKMSLMLRSLPIQTPRYLYLAVRRVLLQSGGRMVAKRGGLGSVVIKKVLRTLECMPVAQLKAEKRLRI